MKLIICSYSIQKKHKSVCAIFFAKKTLIFHNLRCLCHLLVMDSRWVTKQMAQTHVKKKALQKNPPRARGFVSMRTIMFFKSFSYIVYIACFCSYEACKKKDQEKCLCNLFCEKRVWNFTFWDVCAIYLVVMGTKAGKINFEYFFN